MTQLDPKWLRIYEWTRLVSNIGRVGIVVIVVMGLIAGFDEVFLLFPESAAVDLVPYYVVGAILWVIAELVRPTARYRAGFRHRDEE